MPAIARSRSSTNATLRERLAADTIDIDQISSALRSSKRTGRPRKLTPAKEQRVLRWINGKYPMQYGFD